MDRSSTIFGNRMKKSTIRKAVRSKNKYQKKFGDDSESCYILKIKKNKELGDLLGLKEIKLSKEIRENSRKGLLQEDGSVEKSENGIIIGNIRMGYGHYRISMAMASAAHAMGYTPYWMDLNSYQMTTGGKVIEVQNKLYSLGSRLSQKSKLFNHVIWEPLNYEGFRKLSYNACDQKNAELMAPIFQNLPNEMPVIATHVWPAQAAVHAGMKHVVNAIPDNWPMALHLSEGSHHTVQTPSAYLGYRTLYGMNQKKVCHPMKREDISYVGHYIDHELVSNLDTDCESRIRRLHEKKPLRVLLTIGGAGAQREIFASIIEYLLPLIKKKKVALYINVGDYESVWEELKKEIASLQKAKVHWEDFQETISFSNEALTGEVTGIHAFYHSNIFEAVYTTNLLMRSTDLLVTKPSELAFYPVPKLFIKRVGGHEQWGAIHSSEIGDGTLEMRDIPHTLQMLSLLLEDETILETMCHQIITNKKIGIYNGAYEVVRLAMKNGKEERGSKDEAYS